VSFVVQPAEELSTYKEKYRQVTSKAININFACDILICDQILGKRSKSHISQNQTNTTNG